MTYVPGSASQDLTDISELALPDVGTDHSEPLWKRILNFQSVWILGVLVVIVAFFCGRWRAASSSPPRTSRLISQNVSILAVLGVGMTFVIITSGIDLSVGSVLVFSSVIAAKVMAGAWAVTTSV